MFVGYHHFRKSPAGDEKIAAKDCVTCPGGPHYLPLNPTISGGFVFLGGR